MNIFNILLVTNPSSYLFRIINKLFIYLFIPLSLIRNSYPIFLVRSHVHYYSPIYWLHSSTLTMDHHHNFPCFHIYFRICPHLWRFETKTFQRAGTRDFSLLGSELRFNRIFSSSIHLPALSSLLWLLCSWIIFCGIHVPHFHCTLDS